MEQAGNVCLAFFMLLLLLYSPVAGLYTLSKLTKYLSDTVCSPIVSSEEEVWTVKCYVLIRISVCKLHVLLCIYVSVQGHKNVLCPSRGK